MSFGPDDLDDTHIPPVNDPSTWNDEIEFGDE
jgi:hypothetical protein